MMLPEQQRSPKPPFNTEAAPLIFQYSHLFTGCLLRASWVNECKAFHLVGVCQRPSAVASVLWTPSLRALLIEPDQFTETASRLAELPHQRDSNNSALWPLHRRGKKKNKKKCVCVYIKAGTPGLWYNLDAELLQFQSIFKQFAK